MAGPIKIVFVAVAVICYLQSVEMARLPRDNHAAEQPAGLPANFLENFAKPEFWNAFSKNVSLSFDEENLKKYGIRPDDVRDSISKAGENFQNGLTELTKNLQTLMEQNQQPAAAEAKPKKNKTTK